MPDPGSFIVAIGILITSIVAIWQHSEKRKKEEARQERDDNPHVYLSPKISDGRIYVHVSYLTGKVEISFIHPQVLYEKAGWVNGGLDDLHFVTLAPQSGNREADILTASLFEGDEFIGVAIQDNKGEIHYTDEVPQNRRTLKRQYIAIEADIPPEGRRKTILSDTHE